MTLQVTPARWVTFSMKKSSSGNDTMEDFDCEDDEVGNKSHIICAK